MLTDPSLRESGDTPVASPACPPISTAKGASDRRLRPLQVSFELEEGLFQPLQRLRGRLGPQPTVRRLEQPLTDAAQGPGVGLLHEGGVGLVEDVLARELLVHPVV